MGPIVATAGAATAGAATAGIATAGAATAGPATAGIATAGVVAAGADTASAIAVAGPAAAGAAIGGSRVAMAVSASNGGGAVSKAGGAGNGSGSSATDSSSLAICSPCISVHSIAACMAISRAVFIVPSVGVTRARLPGHDAATMSVSAGLLLAPKRASKAFLAGAASATGAAGAALAARGRIVLFAFEGFAMCKKTTRSCKGGKHEAWRMKCTPMSGCQHVD